MDWTSLCILIAVHLACTLVVLYALSLDDRPACACALDQATRERLLRSLQEIHVILKSVRFTRGTPAKLPRSHE